MNFFLGREAEGATRVGAPDPSTRRARARALLQAPRRWKPCAMPGRVDLPAPFCCRECSIDREQQASGTRFGSSSLPTSFVLLLAAPMLPGAGCRATARGRRDV